MNKRILFYSFCAVALVFLLGLEDAQAWHSLRVGGRCKQTKNSCRTTLGNAGGANACCDPRSSNRATCAANNPCEGGVPFKWASMPVQWSLNMNKMPGQSGYANKKAADIEAAMKKAWDAWSKPNCTGFSHKYNGQTTRTASTRDRQNVCFLASSSNWVAMRLPSSVLAVTRPVNSSRGQLIDADIVFNPTPARRPWGVIPNVGRGDMDFADVAAHEIGHALGFGHAAPRTSLMYYSIRSIGPVFKGLSSDEEKGVCTIYPLQKCTSDSQCGACRVCSNSKCGPKPVSSIREQCKGCKSDSDCGSGKCTLVGDRYRCLQPCDSGGCCPNGLSCSTLSGQKFCMPSSKTCPALRCSGDNDCGKGEKCQSGTCQKACQGDTDCPRGAVCKSGTCQKAQPAGRGQPCSNNVPCASGLTCIKTSKGQICTTKCGSGTGTYATGSLGSQCANRQCKDGGRCLGVSGGGTLCLILCQSSNSCNNSGGRCYRMGNVAACLCRSDSECKNGRTCNKTVLGRSGVGACAVKGGGTCPSGYSCENGACVPGTSPCGNGTCDPGENCSSCAKDCGCKNGQTCQNGTCKSPNACGNGTCDNGENCTSCAQDCGCQNGQTCNAGKCENTNPGARCGDGTCDPNENCSLCAADCGCQNGQVCNSGTCQDPGNNPADAAGPTDTQSSESGASAEQGGAGESSVPGTEDGCGCQQQSGPIPFSILFVLCFVFLLSQRRRFNR